jgi:predicted Zn-dependent peptidase
MSPEETYHHQHLPCGVELAALPLPGRRTTAFGIRFLAGTADESDEMLGVARLVDETIGKGTSQKTARQLSDAFDAIGAQCASGVGRESFSFRCSCLPQYVEEALTLYAEMLRTPTFPGEFCDVALNLARQELIALEDEPGELSRKFMAPRAFGPLLGRHELGTTDSLNRIGRTDIVDYWRSCFAADRMQLTIAGAVDTDAITEIVDRLFAGFANGKGDGRGTFPVEFSPGIHHHHKELEQQHILMCWPGVKMTDPTYPVQRVMLAVLSDGMSSRLFTEVREKQGLVYWVDAWAEHPRGAGMIFLGASTTPQRCDQTIRTLLREVDRLGEDLTEEELARAKLGIIAKSQTHGDITRARAGELGRDLFQYARPVPLAEKHEWISAVTVADVQRHLAENPRDRLCALTLGPRALENGDLAAIGLAKPAGADGRGPAQEPDAGQGVRRDQR